MEINEVFEYGEEIKEFLQRHFAPARPDEKDIWIASLAEIHNVVAEALPADVITEMMVFEVLKSLGYQTFRAKIEINSIDEKGKKKKSFVYKYRYFLKMID